jgi:predicted acylesterase/phospholipase RssA
MLGLLHRLEENNKLDHIDAISGVSIGSYIALFKAIGLSSKEMFEICKCEPLLSQKTWKLDNLLKYNGIDDASLLQTKMAEHLQTFMENPDPTFEELFRKTKINLIVTGTNISKKRYEFFSHEHTPDMRVCMAIKISMCVPLYFTKIKYNEDYYIDGCFCNDEPFQPFEKCNYDEVLTICLNSKNFESNDIDSFVSYIGLIVDTLRDRLKIANHFKRIIIDVEKPMLTVDYTPEFAQELFDIGYNITTDLVN